MRSQWSGQENRRNVSGKFLAILADHLVTALHGAKAGRQHCTAGVVEGLSWRDQGLLADDAAAAHFFHLVVVIGNDPVARQQLDGLLALVFDADGVGENITVVVGVRLILQILRLHGNVDALGCGQMPELIIQDRTPPVLLPSTR